ncbi:MAG: OstA-like protein, partial [Flavobacteriaceae bacterium]|nr:OstA-like protein [Flavobacteriaceae bacterium]
VMYFSRNDEQELIGINNTVCSYIDLYLKEQAITGIKFFKKAKGKLYPESELPPNARILKGFIWRGDERLKTVNDLFKGKPRPVLPKIKGIPLPEDEGEFFDDRPLEDIELPESSKLKPKDLQNREDDPKMKTNEDEVIEDDDGENQ